jgi:lipopolysaccharide export LptBFGC system permease protein LptF
VRLLDRYIGRQLFVTSLFAIVVLSAVLVLGNVFKQLLEQVVNKNAPPALIFSFIQYVIPFSLTFTLPWGFLTAVLLVFGRLSADNELTAMRTSGISIPRISLPVGLFAVLFTAICLWINLDVAPAAQKSMKDAITNIATSNPLSLFGSDRVISELPDNKIYVERVDPNPYVGLIFSGGSVEPVAVGAKPRAETTISAIDANSPASRAGFQVGDVVVSVNKAPVADWNGVNHALEALEVGSKATVGVQRGGQPIDVSVTVAGKGNKLHNMHIYKMDDKGQLEFVMFAKEGTLELRPLVNTEKSPTGTFLETATKMGVHWAKSARIAGKKELAIVLEYFDGRYEARSNDHPDELNRWQSGATVQRGSMSMSLQKLYDQKKKIGGVSTLGLEELLSSQSPNRDIEINKRISNAMATIAFALLAVPLGITAQRKETSVGFAISLAIGLVYYLLFFLTDLARTHPKWHPEMLVWAPNVLFLLVGSIRFFQLTRR